MTIPGALKEQPQFGVGQFDALAAFNGLLGLRFAWGTTFGLTLPDIDKALAQLGSGGGLGSGGSNAGTRNIFGNSGLAMLEQIGHGLTHTQAAAADKWVTEAWALDGIGAVIERVAEDAIHTRRVIERKTAPGRTVRLVQPGLRTQLRPVAHLAAKADARAEAAERKAAQLGARVSKLERQVANRHAVAMPLPAPPIVVGGRLGGRVGGRTGRLGKYVGLAAFLALLAKALEKMGANWIRCRNVRRYGRSLCGMNSSLLESLLADALLVVGAISVVEFAKELQTIEAATVAALRGFVREV